MGWFNNLNKSVREKLRKLKVLPTIEILQISSGFFAVVYSIVFFLYFFVKINKLTSFIFFISFILGIYLIYSTRKGIINDSFEQRGKEKFSV